MAKVSFYLFEQSDARQVETTCRLCRKILKQSEKIWLHCPDLALQKQLDEALWNFDTTSFIPHGINQMQAPVCISEQLPHTDDWIVFNFSNQALENFQIFDHIIEIIDNQSEAKILGREKFKQYRRFGIEPRTFKL